MMAKCKNHTNQEVIIINDRDNGKRGDDDVFIRVTLPQIQNQNLKLTVPKGVNTYLVIEEPTEYREVDQTIYYDNRNDGNSGDCATFYDRCSNTTKMANIQYYPLLQSIQPAHNYLKTIDHPKEQRVNAGSSKVTSASPNKHAESVVVPTFSVPFKEDSSTQTDISSESDRQQKKQYRDSIAQTDDSNDKLGKQLKAKNNKTKFEKEDEKLAKENKNNPKEKIAAADDKAKSIALKENQPTSSKAKPENNWTQTYEDNIEKKKKRPQFKRLNKIRSKMNKNKF